MLKYIAPFGLALTDLFIKDRVEEEVGENERIPMRHGWVHIRKMHNAGFSMGRMEDQPEKVRLLSLIGTVLLGIEWLLSFRRKGHFIEKCGWALTFAGALSNTADRYRKGYVVDYIHTQKGPKCLQKIVFNAADAMLTIGGVLLLAVSFVRFFRSDH